jgi:HAD superfamily hydrolase (TIGR01490 family)
MTNNKTNYYAFFDVDGTLVKGKPMLDFLKFYYHKRYSKFPLLANIRYWQFCVISLFLKFISSSRETQNRLYYRCFRNQTLQHVDDIGKEWFSKSITDNSYFMNVVDELKMHKLKGATIVFVSGSFSACLHKIAETFCVNYTLATELEVKNDRYTGKLAAAPMIGYGKHNAILQFLRHKGRFDFDKCFAYGDHISDVQMLSLVGNPVIISGDRKLEAIASKNNWKVINPA